MKDTGHMKDTVRYSDLPFESPSHAAEWCEAYYGVEDAAQYLWNIILANVEIGEYGFASECVAELERLKNSAFDARHIARSCRK